MKLIFLFVGFLISNAINSQTDSIKNINNVIVVDSSIQLHELKSYTSLFIDSTSKLSLEQVASSNFNNQFHPSADSLEISPGKIYWFKFSLTAKGNIANWCLMIKKGNCSYADVWVLNSDSQVVDHSRMGSFVPRSQQSLKELSDPHRVLISINNGETRTIYLRIYNEYLPSYVAGLEVRNPVIGVISGRSNLMTAISASVFVFSILSFFFYFFMKEKAYLFFALYTLTVCLHYLVLHPESIFVKWFIPEHPRLSVPAFYFLAIGGWIFFVLFGKYFIDLPKLSRKLDKMLNWTVLAWIVLFCLTVILIATTRRYILIEANFVFLILFIVFLVRISFFKSVLVRFYVIGALWLVVFSLLGILDIVTSFMNPFPIGQLGQIVIYGIGLAYKMRLNEKDRAEAQVVLVRNVELANLYEQANLQKQEIEIQKTAAEKALVELKGAQLQLIQTEKMASLGELTAGIAHEIQNPLNFVNNFSEINKELLTEIKEEISRKNYDAIDPLANDMIDNEEKINYHGKRASAIVNGMLQHSRSSSGVKEPVDINELVDEYLRLSYHGLKAKDKTFQAKFEIHFNPDIEKARIVRQDIGRVFLNLINNAFYSVNQKYKEGIDNYQPLVKVYTEKDENKIIVRVVDNGRGISKDVLEKIFQPFFTTKPTGQGTGLGLSLSYDIVKAHGGEIKVETELNEGSEFIIILPAV